MHSTEISILKTVAYFDVFNYPVLKEEICFFLDTGFNENEITNALNNLTENKVLFKLDNFYLLKNDKNLIERRLKGNKDAVKELKRAKKISAFLYKWFPYINGLAISGSLSKNFADKNSDFDFFVITAKNRLWVSRIIFTAFYKIACLFGYKKMFCLNYMIDETALEIEEKNIFTATEVATLLPCNGGDIYADFFKANKWVKNLMPNYSPRILDGKNVAPGFIKRNIEKFFNNKTGDNLNERILRFYKKRWQKLSAKKLFTEKGFMFGGMVITNNVCKPLPQHFQQKIINSFTEKFNLAKKVMSENLFVLPEKKLQKQH